MRYIGAVILIIIFAVVAFITLGRGNNNTKSSDSKKPVTSRVTRLASYDSNDAASISWTQQGRIVGDNQFRAIRITVTRRDRTVQVLDGYKLVPLKEQKYGNTPEAFQAFTRALDLANFGKERKVIQADERGVCPLGNRFIYRATEGSKEIMRTWSDNCLAADGPYAGNTTLVAQLFKNQITDYNKFVSGIQL